MTGDEIRQFARDHLGCKETITALEAEVKRLRGKLRKLRDGNWNADSGKTTSFRYFAREALAPESGEEKK